MQLELFTDLARISHYTDSELESLEAVMTQLIDDYELCHNCMVAPSDGQYYCEHCLESALDYLYLAELEGNAIEADWQMQFSL